MPNRLIACGIFENEWNAVKDEFARELETEEVILLEPALHVNLDVIKEEIANSLNRYKEGEQVLLYGNMCHPDLVDLVAEHKACLTTNACDCIGFFVSKEKQQEYAGEEKVFFLTPGWLKSWAKMMERYGWDAVDIRMNFAMYDKMILFDTGVTEIDEEDIIAIYEKAEIPIEIEPITLDYFKENMRLLLQK